MKKLIYFLFLLCLATPLSFVKADGMILPFSEKSYNVDLYETNQLAFIIYEDGKEDLYIKISYQGEVDDFAWVIPTPSEPEPEEASMDIFDELYQISKPNIKRNDTEKKFSPLIDSLRTNDSVVVHSQGIVGVYDFAVLSASKSSGLLEWLDKNGYKVPKEAEDLIEWYLEKDWYFTAIKINKKEFLDKLRDEKDEKHYGYFDMRSNMHPIKLSFLSKELVYPLKISQYSTLSSEKYEKMILDEYPEYENKGLKGLDLIEKWLDYPVEETWKRIKNNIDYDENNNFVKFEDKVVKFSKDYYDKYKNRWWKKNNTEKWFKDVVKRIADEGDRDDLLKFKKCGAFKGYNFNDKNIVSDLQNQLIKDFYKKTKDREYEPSPDYMEKISDLRYDCGRFDGVNRKHYISIMHELKEDFQYYTEEGIKSDLRGLTERRLLPHELKKILSNKNKTNEVLLYVLAKQKVKAPNFDMEFAGYLDDELLADYEKLKEIVSPGMYLTKLRRTFSKKEMDDDVYFVYDIDDSSYRHTIYRGDDNKDKLFRKENPLSESYKNNEYNVFVGKEDTSKIIFVYSGLGFILILGLGSILFVVRKIKNNKKE